MMTDMKTVHGVDLCHCLAARRHARLLTRLYDRHLAPSNLSISQFSVLAMIEARPQLLIAELAEAMVMERTTLVRALKPLLREAEIHWHAAQKEEEAHAGSAKAISIRDSLNGRGGNP
jgi:hypothetical protein